MIYPFLTEALGHHHVSRLVGYIFGGQKTVSSQAERVKTGKIDRKKVKDFRRHRGHPNFKVPQDARCTKSSNDIAEVLVGWGWFIIDNEGRQGIAVLLQVRVQES